jgi:hypothetical protein
MAQPGARDLVNRPGPVARAAALITGDLDADALFATGHRHELGIGTPRIRYGGGALGGRARPGQHAEAEAVMRAEVNQTGDELVVDLRDVELSDPAPGPVSIRRALPEAAGDHLLQATTPTRCWQLIISA